MKRSQPLWAGLLLAAYFLTSASPAWSASQPRRHGHRGMAHKQKVVPHRLAARAPATAASKPVVILPAMMAASLAAPVMAVALPTPAAPVTVPAKGNPYLAYQQPLAPVSPVKNLGAVIDSIKLALPSLPGDGQSLLPHIQTVYPTGEKPLVVLTFKCPTELIGVTPIPIKALHELVNLGMDGVNRSNLLSFNLQQVCQ